MNTLPYGLIKFSLSDAPPKCARWKDHMPAARDQKAYRLYIEARKVWRSKIAWQLTYAEATRILTDVRAAAEMGDWGARALMAQFYLFGLGVLESNHVLDADPAKAIEITRKAAAAMLPWGLYDLGVAYEHGYGGVPYDAELAWAYYLKAAQLGSPEAQMTLAGAYANDGRLDNEELMTQCAYQQGHGPAALALGVDRRVSQNFKESISFFNEGVKLGNKDCASALQQLFDTGYWVTTSEADIPALKALGVGADAERSRRYKVIYDALQINPDLKLSRLDQVLPLPPAKLPRWSGVEDAFTPESNDPPTY